MRKYYPTVLKENIYLHAKKFKSECISEIILCENKFIHVSSFIQLCPRACAQTFILTVRHDIVYGLVKITYSVGTEPNARTLHVFSFFLEKLEQKILKPTEQKTKGISNPTYSSYQ